MTLRYAFNTNGTANHRIDHAVALIADSGFDGVALTLDHGFLDPMEDGWERRTEALARDLSGRGLGSVIETGARFLLDPRAKHEPTFVSAAGRERRVAFLRRAVDIAAILGSEAVSFWAGVPKPGVDVVQAQVWLIEGVGQVLEHAERRGVVAALEPEPGMLCETVDDWNGMRKSLPGLKLALDLGHLLVTEEREPAAAVREFQGVLGTVTIEDMRRGDHTHLPFGEGDMPVAECLAALRDVAFKGLICVELSRESHRADVMVPRSLAALRETEKGLVA